MQSLGNREDSLDKRLSQRKIYVHNSRKPKGMLKFRKKNIFTVHLCMKNFGHSRAGSEQFFEAGLSTTLS